MKKLKKSIAFILTAVMALTVFTIPTFAAVGDEDVQADQQVAEMQESDEVANGPIADVDKEEPEQVELSVQEQAGQFEVVAFPGYMSVYLEWDAVKDADKYLIYRTKQDKSEELLATVNANEVKINRADSLSDDIDVQSSVQRMRYQDKAVQVMSYYSYRIEAASDVTVAESNSVTEKQIQSMGFSFQVKKDHIYRIDGTKKGKKSKTLLKKGKTYYGYGFTGGWYHLVIPEGADGYKENATANAWISKGSTNSASRKAITAPVTYNYSNKVKEQCIRDKGKTSNTKYLIWANLYTQEVTLFEGTKVGTKYSNWKVAKTPASSVITKPEMIWDCASGKASTPTTTGEFSLKTKYYNRHGLYYWNCFLGTEAFHLGKQFAPKGVKQKLKTEEKNAFANGTPVSKGCVRCYPEYVWWLYNGNVGSLFKSSSKKPASKTGIGAPLKTSVWIY